MLDKSGLTGSRIMEFDVVSLVSSGARLRHQAGARLGARGPRHASRGNAQPLRDGARALH